MGEGLHLAGVRIKGIVAGTPHPNRMRFRGVLVQLDTPSSKPPNGAQGHRILVPASVAKRRLKTLIGMGLNYSPDLDGHAQRRKVGVIDKAWIDGKELCVEGHVWKHDFPEAEKDLKQKGLGMSMELGDVRVDHPNSDIWCLDDFQFLGATILWRNSAAYNNTHAIAARAEQRREDMAVQNKKTRNADPQGERVAQIAAEAAASAVRKGTAKVLAVLEENTKTLSEISAQHEELESRLSALETGNITTINTAKDDASSSTSSSASSADQDWKAARSDDSNDGSTSSEDDGTDDSSEDEDDLESAVDKGDLEEEDTDLGQKAGHANDDAKNRGSDGAGDLAKSVGKTVSSARELALRTANRQLRTQLHAAKQQMAKMERKFDHKLGKLQAQVAEASSKMSRKSISPEISAMLSKSNIDASDLFRTGSKLSVAEVDGIIASAGVLNTPQDRIAMKQSFLRAGLMDEGRVERHTR